MLKIFLRKTKFLKDINILICQLACKKTFLYIYKTAAIYLKKNTITVWIL